MLSPTTPHPPGASPGVVDPDPLLQDPHFKASNHRRRIINTSLLTEYAHLMVPGGMLYTITDVPELAEWMVSGRRHSREGGGGGGALGL